VGPRNSLDVLEQKISFLHQESNHDPRSYWMSVTIITVTIFCFIDFIFTFDVMSVSVQKNLIPITPSPIYTQLHLTHAVTFRLLYTLGQANPAPQKGTALNFVLRLNNNNNNNNNNNLISVLTTLEDTFRLTLGCHGGSPSPFGTYDIYITSSILLNHF
jgi:hypothetical protein